MATYSIKDLENFTKIKAHTLRIWEQRYDLLNPERTDTNIRYYSDKDVKKILNINLLYQNGLKISKIALLSEDEIFQKASDLLMNSDCDEEDEVQSFIGNMLELKEEPIQASLKRLNDQLGLERLFPEVLIPLLEKIGTLWQVDAISVSHEHFLSNILREFLIVQIEKIPTSKLAKGKIVLFLPENEKHELSLLFYYFLLKKRHYDCFYLGQSVPMEDLKAFAKEIEPDYIVTSLIAEITEEKCKDIFENLQTILQSERIFAGGYQLKQHSKIIPESINVIQSINDLTL